MASTTFVDKVTVINTAWLNDVNALTWTVFNGKTTAGTAGTLLRSDGTNIVNTTATFPATGGTAGTFLRSDGTNWSNSTATIPATTTANQLLYSSTTNVISGLASAANSLLVTNGSSVPSISNVIPDGVVATTQAVDDFTSKVATNSFLNTALYGTGSAYGSIDHIFGLLSAYASATTVTVATGGATVILGAASGSLSGQPRRVLLTNTYTGTLQAAGSWAAGTSGNKLDTGARANSTWYYIYIIRKTSDGTGDILFSTSASSPTMPSGYEAKRIIGAILTDGSGNIRSFTTMQRAGGGIYYQWTSPILDIDLANTLTTSSRTDTISLPPNTLGLEANLNVYIYDGTSSGQYYISNSDTTDSAPSVTVAPLATGQWSTTAAQPANTRITMGSGGNSLRARSTIATTDTYKVATLGFEWSRMTQ